MQTIQEFHTNLQTIAKLKQAGLDSPLVAEVRDSLAGAESPVEMQGCFACHGGQGAMFSHAVMEWA